MAKTFVLLSLAITSVSHELLVRTPYNYNQ
uniref:Uncharacterized protein n=1 Tax=Rhizophora mucronata TaxID=61149 RepID=A0A2P2PGE3_RHIMU